MAKYAFCRDHNGHKKGEIVEGMQFGENSVMIRKQYSSGYTSHFSPIFLGSQRVLVRLK